jgi:hypothetical protein
VDTTATRNAAVDAFNEAWTLLEKPGRNEVEDDAMLAAAERSHRLWLQVGEPVNDQRGEWMIARAAVDARRVDLALRHMRRVLDLTAAAAVGHGGFGDFDFAFANEVAARALALGGDVDAARRHHVKARELGAAIRNPEDRAEFFRQFRRGPWFGLDRDG